MGVLRSLPALYLSCSADIRLGTIIRFGSVRLCPVCFGPMMFLRCSDLFFGMITCCDLVHFLLVHRSVVFFVCRVAHRDTRKMVDCVRTAGSIVWLSLCARFIFIFCFSAETAGRRSFWNEKNEKNSKAQFAMCFDLENPASPSPPPPPDHPLHTTAPGTCLLLLLPLGMLLVAGVGRSTLMSCSSSAHVSWACVFCFWPSLFAALLCTCWVLLY